MNKFENFCDDCKDTDLPGFQLNEGVATLCKCRSDWVASETLKLNCRDSNIGSHILDLSFEDYVGNLSKDNLRKLQIFINKFSTIGKTKSLYVYGGKGTQKSTMLSVLAKELLKKKHKVYYVHTMDSLIKTLGTFESEKTSQIRDFTFKVTHSDLVIIDECWANKNSYSVTDYQLNTLRSYLKERMEVLQKSIVFISNFPVENIQSRGYSEALADLISRNTLEKRLMFQDNYERVMNDFNIETLWD